MRRWLIADAGTFGKATHHAVLTTKKSKVDFLTPRSRQPNHKPGVPQYQAGDGADERAPQAMPPPRDGAQYGAEDEAGNADEERDFRPVERSPVEADVGHWSVTLSCRLPATPRRVS
jgi:hypothetical protein